MCIYSFVTGILNSYFTNTNKWLVINIKLIRCLKSIFLLRVTVFTCLPSCAVRVQCSELRVFNVSCQHSLPVRYKLLAVFFYGLTSFSANKPAACFPGTVTPKALYSINISSSKCTSCYNTRDMNKLLHVSVSMCHLQGKTRYPLYRRLGGPPGPVWTDAEILTPIGIRSPDGPVRSTSLYRLNYPGPSAPKPVAVYIRLVYHITKCII